MKTCTADKKEVKKCTCMDPLPMAEMHHCWSGPSHNLYALKKKIQSQTPSWNPLHGVAEEGLP